MTKDGSPAFGDQAQRPRRDADRHRPDLQRECDDDFESGSMVEGHLKRAGALSK
jgi:hypothetical protein